MWTIVWWEVKQEELLTEEQGDYIYKQRKKFKRENFDAEGVQEFELTIPEDLIKNFDLKDGSYVLKDQLYNDYSTQLIVKNGLGKMQVKLEPLQSFILKLN